MTYPEDPSRRQPKGDHNRRLALGLEPDVFASHAGITVEQLRKYEMTGPDEDFDFEIGNAVGAALERFEANPPTSQKIIT